MNMQFLPESTLCVVGQAGWAVSQDRSVATRHYPSAVGQKQALLRLCGPADQVGNFSISCEFWSEGRNAAPEGLIMNSTMGPAEMAARVSAFLREVDQKISQTYAVRLAAQSG